MSRYDVSRSGLELKAAIIQDPITVFANTPVKVAIACMSGQRAQCDVTHGSRTSKSKHQESRSSCVVVVDDNKTVIGILTERDVVRLSAQQEPFELLCVEQVMAHPVITLKEFEFDDLFTTINLLHRHRIRHLPILDNNNCLMGVVTHESLLQMTRPIDLLRFQRVEEVMSRKVICATPDYSMLDIARLMAERRVSSVVLVEQEVLDDSKYQIPVGLVTERDLVQFQALDLNFENTPAKAVMSSPVFGVQCDDSLWTVQQLTGRHFIKQVVVTGNHGELLGIVTQTNLLQAFNPSELYKLAEELDTQVRQLEEEKIYLLENRAVELEKQVEDQTNLLQSRIDREGLIAHLAIQIRSSLNLQTILNNTVEQVRRILNCDRVNICQFKADSQGVVVAESTDSPVSLIGEYIEDMCYMDSQAEAYPKSNIRVVSDIYTTEISDYHLELLTRLQIRAKVLVPLYCGDKLWGFLNVIESEKPRNWKLEEIDLLQTLSVQLAIALQQATAHHLLQIEVVERQQAELALQHLNNELESRIAERTEQLQTKETQLQEFLDDANDLIQIVSLADGKFTYLNRSWLEGLGYSEEEVKKITIFDILHPNCKQLYLDLSARMQEGALTCQKYLELTFITKTQTEIIVDGSINCSFEFNRPVATRAIFRDITARKRAEGIVHQKIGQEKLLREITQRIRESLDLQTIFDTACQEIRQVIEADRVGIFKFYPGSNCDDGEFVAESSLEGIPSVKAIKIHDHCFGTNYAPLYLQGRYAAMPDIYKLDKKCHTDVLSKIQVRANLVVPLLCGNNLWGLLCIHQCDGPRNWQQSEANLALQLGNQLAIAIQQATLYEKLQAELLERHQAEQQIIERNQQLAISNEELARATRLKDEFLANMSHELRTPLNAILGMAEGLSEQVFGYANERQIKALTTIDHSAAHLLTLINDILDVAKIESGHIELDYTPTPVASICKSSLSFIKQLAFQKHISLNINIPDNLPDLAVDERRIRQVMINLLNNAVKFTPDGGSITIEVQRIQSNFIRISVSDTGIGISSEDIKKLFQPFIQIDSALNRQYDGTGLGLTLTKRLVELHGGKVEVLSEEGVGSCFMIDLPCIDGFSSQYPRQQPESSKDTENEIEAPPSVKKALILLVEDNEANIQTISNYLEAKGYYIELARNGNDAISMTLAKVPDLILMDIQLPIMDGLEAIRHIRSHSDLANIPIIALTALAMESDKERCLTAGANEYITKPVKLKELVNNIQNLLLQIK